MRLLNKTVTETTETLVCFGPCTLYHGDCLEVLKTLPDNSVDAVVTDPPAGIGFMGEEWDHSKGGRDFWIEWFEPRMKECLRVLKPGGHALVWALPRTSHWTATACEDAGFEIRDRVSHIFGTGFPKNMDVSKAIDKAAGAHREVVGTRTVTRLLPNDVPFREGLISGHHNKQVLGGEIPVTAPATPEAAQWEGWGTALKPACEDWWLCRKPLGEKNIAANVLKYGTGALNIDGCRVPTTENLNGGAYAEKGNRTESLSLRNGSGMNQPGKTVGVEFKQPSGRFPAHLIHDGSEEVLAGFPDTGVSTGGRTVKRSGGGNVGSGKASEASWSNDDPGFGDSGSAARFFYCTKAPKRDRNEGGVTNKHPTVKNTELMRYLCRLITPPNGIVLDPFAGSFSTGKAAIKEGFRFIGIEAEREYFETGVQRLRHEVSNCIRHGDHRAVDQERMPPLLPDPSGTPQESGGI